MAAALSFYLRARVLIGTDELTQIARAGADTLAARSVSLYFDVLRWSLERGNTAVDLVGRVDEGIARFKTGMGGVETPYTNVASSPLPRAVRDAGVKLWQTTQRG